MIRTAALLAALLATSAAHAEGQVGVVVTGDAKLQAPLTGVLEKWLRGHGRELFAAPLDPDAINTLVDCFVIEDQACARDIIDRRAKSEAVVFAKIEATPAKKPTRSGTRDIAITAYWFVKGREAASERRTCEHCTDEGIRTTADGIMKVLAGTTGAAKLAEPEPPHDAPPEQPKPEVVAPLPAPVPPPPIAPQPLPETPGPSRALPIAVGAVGAAALVVGFVLFMHEDDGSAPTYRDTKAAGVVVGIGGLALLGLDVYLWLDGGKRESRPVVSVTPTSAMFGWARSF